MMTGPNLEEAGLSTAQARTLNDELIADDTGPKEIRRNSKDDIIRKIMTLCEENGVTLEQSNTKLRRMTKSQLQEVLAHYAEKVVQCEMARQVGADPSGIANGASPNAVDTVIALGALRMVHDLMAATTERGCNAFLPSYGYEIDGFVDTLREPSTREATDQCLKEIAAQSDVLGYVQSPYSRLAICWIGALAGSFKKAERIRKTEHATGVGPRTGRLQDPLQPRPVRRPAPREVRRDRRPAPADVDEV